LTTKLRKLGRGESKKLDVPTVRVMVRLLDD